jgi:hypothetical protein
MKNGGSRKGDQKVRSMRKENKVRKSIKEKWSGKNV